VILNFTPVPRHDYRVPAPAGAWVEIFNSDAGHYGGSGLLNRADIRSEPWHFGGRDHSLVVTLPPLGGVVLQLLRS
jgi:1,4-alpha-glucan branching enzyme